jgi:hypothetical protein
MKGLTLRVKAARAEEWSEVLDIRPGDRILYNLKLELYDDAGTQYGLLLIPIEIEAGPFRALSQTRELKA